MMDAARRRLPLLDRDGQGSERQTRIDGAAAALIQADPTDDPIIIGHVRSAHELTIELRRRAAREAALKEVDHATF